MPPPGPERRGTAEFRVSLATGHSVDVASGAGGVDVDAMLARMAAARASSRANALERSEAEEAYTIRLMVLSELVAAQPPGRAAQLQTLRAA